MVIKAPNGHTSIYPCQHLKKNWKVFQRYLTASGQVSFNAHVNNVLVKDFNENHGRVLKSKTVEHKRKINMHDDTIQEVKDKMITMTDGEVLDYLNEVSDHRKLIMRDATKRGIKL